MRTEPTLNRRARRARARWVRQSDAGHLHRYLHLLHASSDRWLARHVQGASR